MIAPGLLLKRTAPLAIAIGVWFAPIPAGLTAHAWHLFGVFTAAIASVLLGSYPLLTAALIAVGTVIPLPSVVPKAYRRRGGSPGCECLRANSLVTQLVPPLEIPAPGSLQSIEPSAQANTG